MKKHISTIVSYAIVALILLSLPMINPDYRRVKVVDEKEKKSFLLSDIQKLYPNALSYQQEGDKSYTVLAENGTEIAKFIVSNDFLDSNFGYAGEVNVLIGFRGGIIDGTTLLENVESRGYVKKIEKNGLLKAFDQSELSKIPTIAIDGVSGATFTSEAVIRAVKESTGSYLQIAAEANKVSIVSILKIVLFALIILLSLVSSFKKGMSKYRTVYLVFLIISAGFALQTMLSITLFDGWIKQGISLANSWQTVLLLLLALVMPMFGKNKYYCTFLCPMGALQELTSKLSPIKKRSLKISQFHVNDLYLLLIVVAMFSSIAIDFTNLEPFMAFAITIAPWFMLVFGAVVILFSLFFNRPWCAVCPTGCALNHLSLPKIKRHDSKK